MVELKTGANSCINELGMQSGPADLLVLMREGFLSTLSDMMKCDWVTVIIGFIASGARGSRSEDIDLKCSLMLFRAEFRTLPCSKPTLF